MPTPTTAPSSSPSRTPPAGSPHRSRRPAPPARRRTSTRSYGQPLQARVLDANGNPVQGATVDFSVVPGLTGASARFLGPSRARPPTRTGSPRSPPLLANGVPGRYTATASTAGVSTVATYTLDNHAAAMTLRRPRCTFRRRHGRQSLSIVIARAPAGRKRPADRRRGGHVRDHARSQRRRRRLRRRRKPGDRGHRRRRTCDVHRARRRTRPPARSARPPPPPRRRPPVFTLRKPRRRAGPASPPAPPSGGTRHRRRALPGPARRHRHRQERQPGCRRDRHLPRPGDEARADSSCSARISARPHRARPDERKGIAVAPPFVANRQSGGYAVIRRLRAARCGRRSRS